MAQPLTWIGLSATSLLGIALGVQMGHSAIGEINPVYFQSSEPRLTYADLSGYRSPSWAPQQTSLPPLYDEPSPAPEYPDYPEDGSAWREVSGPAPESDSGAASAPEPAVYRPAQLVLEKPPLATDMVERYSNMPVEPVAAEVETAAVAY